MAVLAVAAFGPSRGVIAADNGHRAFGDVSVFASAPAPGHGDLEPGTDPAAWEIFKVGVGETGLPLNRPKT